METTVNVADIFEWYCGLKNLDLNAAFKDEFGFSIFDDESNFEDEINHGHNYAAVKSQKIGFTVPLITADKNFMSRLDKLVEKTFKKKGTIAQAFNLRDVKSESLKRIYDKFFPDETDIIINIAYSRNIDRIAHKEYLQVQEAKKT